MNESLYNVHIPTTAICPNSIVIYSSYTILMLLASKILLQFNSIVSRFFRSQNHKISYTNRVAIQKLHRWILTQFSTITNNFLQKKNNNKQLIEIPPENLMR